jgi:hypothetical protein
MEPLLYMEVLILTHSSFYVQSPNPKECRPHGGMSATWLTGGEIVQEGVVGGRSGSKLATIAMGKVHGYFPF